MNIQNIINIKYHQYQYYHNQLKIYRHLYNPVLFISSTEKSFETLLKLDGAAFILE